MANILPIEVERVKKNIEQFPKLKEVFGNDWLDPLLVIEERERKHPLFWFISDTWRCSHLIYNLDTINVKVPLYTHIINKLKSTIDRFNFHSLITEIEVIGFYLKNFPPEDIEYEPKLSNSNKKMDLKVKIDGEDYYLEILAIFDDKQIIQIEKIQDKIRKELDLIEQPYILSISTSYDFNEGEINGFVNFVNEVLKSNETISSKASFDYFRDTKKIAEIRFYEAKENLRGGVGFMHLPTKTMETPGRLKQKILTKVNQLPRGTNNIVVVNLSYITLSFIDVEEAFLGQSSVIVSTETNEAKSIRNPNGIIHHKNGKFISMVIAYTKEDYSNKAYFINLSADRIINPLIAERL